MRLLLAEDEPASRAAAALLLQAPGREIALAEDGEQAWGLLQREPVHIVISDWSMPGLDGLELCRRLRRREAAGPGHYTYFLLLSATNWGREHYLQAMEGGVDDFLYKPVDPAHLAVRLRAAERMLGCMQRLRDLEGVIPICSYCRRLRDDQEAYQQMEAYFRRHARLSFSHGICPDCLSRHFPEEARSP